MEVTCDASIVETNHLPSPVISDPNKFAYENKIEEFESWRRSKDALYRVFTNTDPTELNQFVLGLIASGVGGTKVGLLRNMYYQHIDDTCKHTMDKIEQDILESQLQINTETHRMVCHCLLLVATMLESEFLSYIVLHTYNRETLRYYLNQSLQYELQKLLQGGFDRMQKKERQMQGDVGLNNVLPFEIQTFVCNARHAYSIYCMPRKTV